MGERGPEPIRASGEAPCQQFHCNLGREGYLLPPLGKRPHAAAWGNADMGLAHLVSPKGRRFQLRWDRIYLLTLALCFWTAAAEIAYFLV